MDLKSKFNCGDVVYSISYRKEKVLIDCPFCEGDGIITGKNNVKHSCPDCSGRCVHTIWKDFGWLIDLDRLTIGQIRLEFTCNTVGILEKGIFDNYNPHSEQIEESYMCIETGIGSGSVHYADRLFATKQEALEECERRNREESNGKMP